MANELTKTQLIDAATQTNLAPKSLAESIYFRDGETLQFKYDNGKLSGSDIFQGIIAVSPTVEVVENDDAIYRLKITDINGSIITPNLIGPKGETGPISDGEGNIIKAVNTYEQHFVAGDFSEISENSYILRINRVQHELGFNATVKDVLRYLNDSEIVSVSFGYKRLVNGDILLYSNEPFAGIIYLEAIPDEE